MHDGEGDVEEERQREVEPLGEPFADWLPEADAGADCDGVPSGDLDSVAADEGALVGSEDDETVDLVERVRLTLGDDEKVGATLPERDAEGEGDVDGEAEILGDRLLESLVETVADG